MDKTPMSRSAESPPLVRERLGDGDQMPPFGQNHPRSCGKDLKGDRVVVLGRESPPLVRERLIAR